MKITNKWVIKDGDDVFSKMNGNHPMMFPLDSRARLYDSKRAAESGVRRIYEMGGEYIELLHLKAEYIEEADVPDYEEPSGPPIIENTYGWHIVDSFGKIAYLRKEIGEDESGLKTFEYAVAGADGKLRGFGTDELAAWIWYSDYRRDFGANRIKARRGEV